jgi:hypothetical protein
MLRTSAPQPTLENAANTSTHPVGLVPTLCARLDSCWERLIDAVDELAALHEIDEREIVDRVHRALADGCISPTWDEAAGPHPAEDGSRS